MNPAGTAGNVRVNTKTPTAAAMPRKNETSSTALSVAFVPDCSIQAAIFEPRAVPPIARSRPGSGPTFWLFRSFGLSLAASDRSPPNAISCRRSSTFFCTIMSGTRAIMMAIPTATPAPTTNAIPTMTSVTTAPP